ncbi:N(2),N(2)-dimethylguanosine tRNA methyltransferase [Aureococcus anophagefferens]|nr:N(2),N(2)-dimethylguanosine tRNA methyltransferase [Aureococcus anophagefferens]
MPGATRPRPRAGQGADWRVGDAARRDPRRTDSGRRRAGGASGPAARAQRRACERDASLRAKAGRARARECLACAGGFDSSSDGGHRALRASADYAEADAAAAERATRAGQQREQSLRNHCGVLARGDDGQDPTAVVADGRALGRAAADWCATGSPNAATAASETASTSATARSARQGTTPAARRPQRPWCAAKGPGGTPLPMGRLTVKYFGPHKCKTKVNLAEVVAQYLTAAELGVDVVADDKAGCGGLAHKRGASYLFAWVVDVLPGDEHRASRFVVGDGLSFSANLEAELAAAAATEPMPLASDGDVDVKLRKRRRRPPGHVPRVHARPLHRPLLVRLPFRAMAAATDAPSKKRDASAMDAGYQRITEGSASMNYELRGADTRNRGTADHDGPVFYNKVQVFNRDLSVLMISLFAQWRHIERAERKAKRDAGKAGDGGAAAAAERERLYALSAADLDALLRAEAQTDGIRVLDALAATGLRSIRYAKEVPASARSSPTTSTRTPRRPAGATPRRMAPRTSARPTAAAVDFMTASRGKGSQGFDVIDLDPYGSCAPFLDAAVQAVNDGGLLCVTSTDMTVLSGNYPEVCFAKYGSMPTKAKHLHEFALRILVHAIEAAAAKYQRHVVPVLSLSIDFYVRVFVRVYKRPAEVKKSAAKRAFVLQTRQAPVRGGARSAAGAAVRQAAPEAPPTEEAAPAAPEAALDETVAPAFCGETGAPFKIGGPIWSAPLHDPEWVLAGLDRVAAGVDAHLSTTERIHGMLTAVSEELLDVPLYYTLPDLCSALHCASPKMAEVRAALTHAGYRVSQHHREPDAIKTDAPPRVLWDVFRCWVKKHPVSEKRLAEPRSAAAKILATAPVLEANFATTAAMRAKATKARRWAPNPEEHWGPKAAARGRKQPKLQK